MDVEKRIEKRSQPRNWRFPLEHPTTAGPSIIESATPILRGPLLVRSRIASRWHRPRSGLIWAPNRWHPKERVSWHLWCGSGFAHGDSLGIAKLPTDGMPVCGSCEGRAVGAGYPPVTGMVTYPTVFEPSSQHVPARCPGSRTELLVELAPRAGRCLVCGSEQKIGGGGGWHNPTWGLANHAPGPDLVSGCRWHRWSWLILVDGRLQCRCGPLPKITRRGVGTSA